MNKVYENEAGGIRIYEDAAGKAHHVRAERATIRQVAVPQSIGVSPEKWREIGEEHLNHVIVTDYEGEPFGDVELSGPDTSPEATRFAAYILGTTQMVAHVVVIDYFRHYWPAAPEEED